ncbi:uncharacterized protein VTP21DRAFT_9394 [Calcarisporiella thermophila]|uniref:uncharacterized protein n=1 Tax=Calcarisporiella thermophila TaxID=911321 RepID=UPI0037448637
MPAPIEVSVSSRPHAPTTLRDPEWYEDFLPTPYESEELTDDYFATHDLEAAFFRDSFSCCGKRLGDLHDLLNHHEECHFNEFEDDYEEEEAEEEEELMTRRHRPSISEERVASIVGRKRANSQAYDGPVSKRMLLSELGPSAVSDENLASAVSMLVASMGDAAASGDSLMEELLSRKRDELALLEQHLSRSSSAGADMRPHRCQSCGKTYKNSNGLRYHHQHGHCSDGADEDALRPYRCSIASCGKRYKNLNGLRYHESKSHPQLQYTSLLGALSPGQYGPPNLT